MDWYTVSAIWGTFVPLFIEIFAKKVHGQWKIVIVFAFCLGGAVVSMGLDGGFDNWSNGNFALAFLGILTLATNTWAVMWKKFFSSEPDPLKK